MRRVLKYELPPEQGAMFPADREIPWSLRDRVLLVAGQDSNGYPTLWIEQECYPSDHKQAGEPRAYYGLRLFAVVETGAGPPAGWEHIGSALCASFAWHVYAVPIEKGAR